MWLEKQIKINYEKSVQPEIKKKDHNRNKNTTSTAHC